MITGMILFLITGMLQLIYLLFSGINFIIPSAIPNAFTLFFSYVRLGDGLIPFLGQAMLAIFTVLTVWAFVYLIKLFLTIYQAIPWIGKKVDLPNNETVTTSSSFDAHGKYQGTRRTRSHKEAYKKPKFKGKPYQL